MSEQHNAARTPPQRDLAGDPRARLRARLDREAKANPPSWYAEPGDELIGTFREWRSGTTRRGETHPIAVVEDATTGKPVAAWGFYHVLRAELEKANPQPGELLAIRRLPDREGPNGAYRVYRVAVDRDDQAEPFAGCAPPVDGKGVNASDPAEPHTGSDTPDNPAEPKPAPEPELELGLAAPCPFD